jgi:hypothetical protein
MASTALASSRVSNGMFTYFFPSNELYRFLFSVKNLSANAEVLLNYGNLFFKAESDDGDKKKKRKEVSIENLLELDQHSSDETYND